jgi:hypothetical protein
MDDLLHIENPRTLALISNVAFKKHTHKNRNKNNNTNNGLG